LKTSKAKTKTIPISILHQGKEKTGFGRKEKGLPYGKAVRFSNCLGKRL